VTDRRLLRINPNALDPFEHNRIVQRRKTYRRLARDFRAAGRTSHKSAASFRMLALSADRAAESLRHFGDTLRGTNR
jgi:hypothetical protein